MARVGSNGGSTTTSEDMALPVLAVAQPETKTTSTLSLAVPQKLLQKILDMEYVEMSELLPETWGLESGATSSCSHDSCRQMRRGPVTDILLWLNGGSAGDKVSPAH